MQFYCPSLWCLSHGSCYVIVLYLLFILGWSYLSIHEDVYNFEFASVWQVLIVLLFFAVFVVWSQSKLTCKLRSSSHVQRKPSWIQPKGTRDCGTKLDCRIKPWWFETLHVNCVNLESNLVFSVWGIRSRTWNEWGVVSWGRPIIELRDSFRCHSSTYSYLKDLQEHCHANLEI